MQFNTYTMAGPRVAVWLVNNPSPEAAALTAAGLAHVIDDGGGERLRACSRAGCGVVFADTSRNGRRRVCSVRCANQVNVANHRLRRRHAPARWH